MAQKKSSEVPSSPSTSVEKCSTGGDASVDFILIQDKKFTPPATKKGKQLPKKYSVYQVDNNKLNEAFKKIKDGHGGTLNFPIPGNGCQAFTLVESGTLSKELAAKYPEIISLKGQALQNAANDARVDYNGKQLQVEINWDGEVYYITPWIEKGKLWYLLSSKKDTGYEKVPYE